LDIEQSPFDTHDNAPEPLVKLGFDLLVRPLHQRLLGPAQFGVLRDETDNAFEQFGAM
jgi:hypothetical protein